MLFATGGTLIKLQTLPSLQRAGSRALVAALVIFALWPAARRLPNRRVLLLVPAYFGATCLFVVANTLTTASNAIFLQSTAPLWVVLLAPLLLRERPTRADLFVLAGVGLGMAAFFAAPAAAVPTAPQPRLGDWIAVASGVSYALLLLGLRWLSRTSTGEEGAAVAWGNLLTFPLALALMPLVGQRPGVGVAADWVVVGLLGVFQVGLAYVLLARGLAGVPAARASLLLMVEPALSTLLAWVVHGERPEPLAAAGGAAILISVSVGTWLASQRAPASAGRDWRDR
jgi:drug/metabolite transporter (DMT)-like permease